MAIFVVAVKHCGPKRQSRAPSGTVERPIKPHENGSRAMRDELRVSMNESVFRDHEKARSLFWPEGLERVV